MSEKPDTSHDENQQSLSLVVGPSALVCCSAFAAGYMRYGVRNTCDRCKLAVIFYSPSSGDPGYFRKFRVGPHGNSVIDTSGFFGTIQLVNEEDCVPAEGRAMLGDVEADSNQIQENYAKHMRTTQWYAMCENYHEPWIAQYMRYSEIHAQADADAHDAAVHNGQRNAIVLPYD